MNPTRSLTLGALLICEFISYVRSAEIAERAVAQVQAATKTHEVQQYVEPDPKWRVYDQFAM